MNTTRHAEFWLGRMNLHKALEPYKNAPAPGDENPEYSPAIYEDEPRDDAPEPVDRGPSMMSREEEGARGYRHAIRRRE